MNTHSTTKLRLHSKKPFRALYLTACNSFHTIELLDYNEGCYQSLPLPGKEVVWMEILFHIHEKNIIYTSIQYQKNIQSPLLNNPPHNRQPYLFSRNIPHTNPNNLLPSHPSNTPTLLQPQNPRSRLWLGRLHLLPQNQPTAEQLHRNLSSLLLRLHPFTYGHCRGESGFFLYCRTDARIE